MLNTLEIPLPAFGHSRAGGVGWVQSGVSLVVISASLILCCPGCAEVHTRESRTPFERSWILHREPLANAGVARLSVRREGSQVAVRLEDVTLCRDDLLVSRGIEMTTHRSLDAETKTWEWLAFAGSVGLAALGTANLREPCPADDPYCDEAFLAALAMAVGMIGTVISGPVLVVDTLRATDTSNSIETSRSSEQRTRACGSTPRQRTVVQIAHADIRVQTTTNSDGRAVLELNLPSGPLADIPVQLWLDGSG